MTSSEQTLTQPRQGLPHGGQHVDRRIDPDEAAALASSSLPSLPLTAAERQSGTATLVVQSPGNKESEGGTE